MDKLLEAFGFGLVTASLLVFGAGGFSLQYGLSNVFNFAYGSIMIVSAFVAYAAVRAGLSMVPALVLAAAFGAVLSLVLNAWVYRPFARRGVGLFGLAFVSVSLSVLLQYLTGLIWGESFVSLQFSSGPTVHLGPMVFTSLQLRFIVGACIAFAVLHAILRYTRVGRAIRATAANPLLARHCGIGVARVVDATWLASGAMCGVAGFYLAIELGSFSYTSGQSIFPIMLAAAMIGNIGSIAGAFLGSILVGVSTEVLAAYFDPALKEAYGFAILVVVLLARRQAIMRGENEQAVVA